MTGSSFAAGSTHLSHTNQLILAIGLLLILPTAGVITRLASSPQDRSRNMRRFWLISAAIVALYLISAVWL